MLGAKQRAPWRARCPADSHAWLTSAAVTRQAARALGPGHTIVTVMCDGGHRHLSRFHSPAFLASVGLAPEHQGDDLGFVA